MRQYGMFKALFMSFYSKSLYRDVAQNWGGYAILYLLLLVTLSWIPLTILMQTTFNHLYEQDSDQIVRQIPTLDIKDGKINTPEKRPYIIHSLDNNKDRLVVIDTTGKYKTLQQAQSTMLVTQTQVLTQTKPDEIRINDVPTNLTIVLDPQVINGYLKTYIGYAWILIFPCLVLFGFIYRFIQVLIYSLFGKFFSFLMKGAPLSYGQIMLIAMVALTPATVFCTAFGFFGVTFAYQPFFYFALAMAYLVLGIKANK